MNTARLTALLLFVACLLAGTIAGYYAGSQESRRAGSTALSGGGALSGEVVALVMGFSCPVSGCNERLHECQHGLARNIRTWVEAKLSEGASQEEISRDLIRQHGPNLFHLP